ncbi:MAG: very short patch repair endonuclease [Coriobacteriales bacterium]|nr:very short patch repair endonuclease [Actinomycetes bacterium]
MTSRLGPAPEASSEAVSRSMKGNRGKNTRPEMELRRLLRAAGYPGYRLHWKEAPGHPDIAYPGRKVAIFVNGCFWHRCPRCDPPLPKRNQDFWMRKFQLNRERDQRKLEELVSAGWTVMVVWECELAGDTSELVRRLVEKLETRP